MISPTQLRNFSILAILGVGLQVSSVGADTRSDLNDRKAGSRIQQAYSDSIEIETLHQLAFEALRTSYPDLVLKYGHNSLILEDGTEFVFDDSRLKDAQQLLDDPDIFDMFVYAYPIRGVRVPETGAQVAEHTLKLPSSIPYLEDPGRVRVQGFFKKIYGSAEEDIKQTLTSVKWIPSGKGTSLPISNRNGVAKALQRVSDELDKKPELWPYLVPPGGSFYWRSIAGTDRLSMHSFGIAVDINVARSDYWHDVVSDETAKVVYRNRIPAEIIEIFENDGFIWGGWWYHFDTMHFEYRPELLEYTKLVASFYQKHFTNPE